MSKSIIIVDIIKASTGNSRIPVQSLAGYDISRNVDDLDNLDFITKEIFEAGGGGSGGGITIPVPVIPAGTPIPFFIDASLYSGSNANFDVITKATFYDPATLTATGQLTKYNDMPVVDQDTNDDGTGDFTGWNIYGHDDGAGNFKEDTYVILRG